MTETDFPLLEIRDLCLHYRQANGESLAVLKDINLSLSRGEILAVVGESGSGKSTLAKAIVGLTQAGAGTKSRGEIFLNGERLPDKFSSRDFRKYAPLMQMVFQDPYGSLNPRWSVRRILCEALPGRKERAADALIEMLSSVGLQEQHLGLYPHQLSGGQRQRVGIARALAVSPDLLICDEPSSALDVSVQAQIINLLLALKKQRGLTMIFISHDLALARLIADRVVVMRQGSIVEQGDCQQVFKRPRHPYTRSLLAAIPGVSFEADG